MRPTPAALTGILAAVVLAACGGREAASPSPEGGPMPGVTTRVGTATPFSSPASEAVATAAPPTTAAVPAPTFTPTPAPSPTATAIRPTSTAAPVLRAIPRVELGSAYPQLPDGAVGPKPLFYTFVPDRSGRVVVLDQGGKISIFENDMAADHVKVFLDLSEKVSTQGNEEGLLGLAFHPRFRENRTFYVYYSAASPRRSVLSRFTVGDDPNKAEPASEMVVLEIPQPFSNHNGGMLAFGPDGYLYIALGDGGGGGDPNGNGQNLGELLGSILRIDVDQPAEGQSYGIPPDNPFVDRPSSVARHEIWAYGLRNPWRFSFDRAMGDLWAGDVGQNSWEEVDRIEKGANYGWNIMEGAHCFRSATCDQRGLALPVAEYETGRFGCSVIGGHVYRGKQQRALEGVYLYADFCSGLVWGLRHDGKKVIAGPELIAETDLFISSFGQDEAGELYVTSFGGLTKPAGVYRVVAR